MSLIQAQFISVARSDITFLEKRAQPDGVRAAVVPVTERSRSRKDYNSQTDRV